MKTINVNTKTAEQTKAFLHTLAGRIKNAGLNCEDEKCAKYLVFRAQELHKRANNGIAKSIGAEFHGKLMEISKKYPKKVEAGQAFDMAAEIEGMIPKEPRLY